MLNGWEVWSYRTILFLLQPMSFQHMVNPIWFQRNLSFPKLYSYPYTYFYGATSTSSLQGGSNVGASHMFNVRGRKEFLSESCIWNYDDTKGWFTRSHDIPSPKSLEVDSIAIWTIETMKVGTYLLTRVPSPKSQMTWIYTWQPFKEARLGTGVEQKTRPNPQHKSYAYFCRK